MKNVRNFHFPFKIWTQNIYKNGQKAVDLKLDLYI
jgi:hypothetical protein